MMSFHWLTQLLLCLLVANCVKANENEDDDEGSGMRRTIDSTTWKFSYCNCFNDPAEIRSSCFKNFFKQRDVRSILRRHKENRQSCFEPNKDGDNECRVVRNHQLSIKFRRDIKDLEEAPDTSTQKIEILKTFWRGHPDILKVCDQVQPAGTVTRMIERFSKLTLADIKIGKPEVDSLYPIIGEKPLGKELYEVVLRVCYSGIQSKSSTGDADYKQRIEDFCDIDAVIRLVRKMTKLKQIAMRVSMNQQENLYKAFRLNFVTLVETFPEHYTQDYNLEVSDDEKDNGYKNNIQTIIKLLNDKDIDQLRDMSLLFPNDILTCTGSQDQTTEACYFKRILDQIILHFRTTGQQLDGRHIIKLSTSLNYKQLLEYRILNNILRVVQENQFLYIDLAEGINDNTNRRFVELREYFQTLQSFANTKANADIDFIDGWINGYKSIVKRTSSSVGTGLGDLLKAYITGTTLNLAEKATRMGVAIAEACNPLKTMFGGTTLSDILDATAEFVAATSEIALAANLNAQLNTLIDTSKEIASKLDENSNAIKEVIDLIRNAENVDSQQFEIAKRGFFDRYRDYSPAVRRTDIERLEGFWSGVVELACAGMDGIDTALGMPAVAFVKAEGLCWKIPRDIKEMITAYTEIYDFQFELMETLAQAMRAQVGKREVSNIASNIRSFPEVEENLARKYRSIYTLSYITYLVQTWSIVENYCNELQYKEGGVRPRLCRGEKTVIENLLARRSESRCSTSDNSETVNIPIRKEGMKDSATLNITKLYRGFYDSFQITSSQWLVDNKWLLPSQADKVMYIKSFELFLPTVSEESVTFVSKSFASGKNLLRPCETCNQYVLRNPPQETTFKEGKEAQCDDSRKINNPYTICRPEPLPKICRVTDARNPSDDTLFPSVFARWRFRVEGYRNTAVAIPGNQDMYIRAKITYRLVNCDGGRKRSIEKPKAESTRKRTVGKHTAGKRSGRPRKCCDDGKYFSVALDQCTSCPEGRANLKGYYCEKNNNAMMT